MKAGGPIEVGRVEATWSDLKRGRGGDDWEYLNVDTILIGRGAAACGAFVGISTSGNTACREQE